MRKWLIVIRRRRIGLLNSTIAGLSENARAERIFLGEGRSTSDDRLVCLDYFRLGLFSQNGHRNPFGHRRGNKLRPDAVPAVAPCLANANITSAGAKTDRRRAPTAPGAHGRIGVNVVKLSRPSASGRRCKCQNITKCQRAVVYYILCTHADIANTFARVSRAVYRSGPARRRVFRPSVFFRKIWYPRVRRRNTIGISSHRKRVYVSVTEKHRVRADHDE